MFDNIVANNNINLNDLEKKIYKFVCNLGCCILKTLLENYDNKIKEIFPHVVTASKSGAFWPIFTFPFINNS